MSHFDPKTSSYVYKNYFWNAPAMAPAAGAALKVDFVILYQKFKLIYLCNFNNYKNFISCKYGDMTFVGKFGQYFPQKSSDTPARCLLIKGVPVRLIMVGTVCYFFPF